MYEIGYHVLQIDTGNIVDNPGHRPDPAGLPERLGTGVDGASGPTNTRIETVSAGHSLAGHAEEEVAGRADKVPDRHAARPRLEDADALRLLLLAAAQRWTLSFEAAILYRRIERVLCRC